MYKIFSILLLLTATVCANSIKEVKVFNAQGKEIQSGFVLNNIKSKPGTTLAPRVLSSDIRRLYQTNEFINVETEFDEGTGVLKITITRRPKLLEIVIEGYEEIDEDDIRDELELVVGEPLDETVMASDKHKISKLYDDEGYYSAEVLFNLETTDNPEEVVLRIIVDEKSSLQVDEVRFHGNTVIIDDDLASSITTKPSFWRYMFDTGFFNELIFEADLKLIKRLYKARGYLDFKIEKVVKKDDGEYLELDIFITEGRPYIVGNVSISGNSIFSTVELNKLVTVKKGFSYSSLVEDADIDRITTKYQNEGYLDLYCSAQLNPNPQTHIVDIDYRISEGVPSRIRDIIITGNTDTKEYVIRRELAIQPDDKANKDLINKSKTRLMNMNYFEKVDVTPVNTEIEGLKDLQLKVTEKSTGQLGLGGGFSSADSFVGSVNFSQSNFDLYDGWPFIGGGQRFQSRAQFGSERQDLTVGWVDPWFLGKPLSLSTSFFLSERYYDDYDQEKVGYEIGLTKRLSKYPLWTIRHAHRLYQIDINMDDDVSKELEDEETSDISSAYILTLRKDTRNSTRRPNEGGIMEFKSEWQSVAIASDNESAKLKIRWTTYNEAFEDSVLKLHAEINSLIGDDPIYDRYFGGGIGRVRGYDERELGPVDSNGDPIGGASFLLLSAELDVPFNKTFNGVWFVDVGNVWEDSFDFTDISDASLTTGPGLRINLPIGVVELYYGKPIVDNAAEEDDSGSFHFNMGYNF
ncbi:outer membrane protein assembly factor BamA [Lentisphaera profundi]|uniref:Outer membrane protein assembly factor BamA n=1 Tax=Lentisphaera profundi TaxID=1658616 RepID=A0ABY7VXL8_9BACT|nr:outer membrane protein assembly factor BamA [Lentisphaera profundi]WDE98024.1 outer membrane protein assembly factor BamA [Lentisphaera profundi]